MLGTVQGSRASRRTAFTGFPCPSMINAATKPMPVLSTTEPTIHTTVFFTIAGNSFSVTIFSKFRIPLNCVSKDGSVTSENANDMVRIIGTIIIKSTTMVHGATNFSPVRARFCWISGWNTPLIKRSMTYSSLHLRPAGLERV